MLVGILLSMVDLGRYMHLYFRFKSSRNICFVLPWQNNSNSDLHDKMCMKPLHFHFLLLNLHTCT